MAAVEGGDGGKNNNDDPSAVFQAVDAGASVGEVRQLLVEAPDAWRTAALNYRCADGNETALQAAHRRRDGAIVGVLLEHGADPTALHPNANALVVCIAYGQVNSLRVLLSSGRHSANEQVARPFDLTTDYGSAAHFTRPVHLCVAPPRIGGERTPPQIECLKVLVVDFGADVNGRDFFGYTPLARMGCASRAHQRSAYDALVALGADLNSGSGTDAAPIFTIILCRNLEMLQDFFARGGTADVVTSNGNTPLIHAATWSRDPGDVRAAEVFLAALRASSDETRRSISTDAYDNGSALDVLLERCATYSANIYDDSPAKPLQLQAIYELAASRVPVCPEHAAAVLPYFARVGERRARELALREAQPSTWRAHEAFVGLAFGFLELREADEAVARREGRVREFEEELRALGVGTEDTEEEEEEAKDKKEREAPGSS
jgi:ankyrin repeat protein